MMITSYAIAERGTGGLRMRFCSGTQVRRRRVTTRAITMSTTATTTMTARGIAAGVRGGRVPGGPPAGPAPRGGGDEAPVGRELEEDAARASVPVGARLPRHEHGAPVLGALDGARALRSRAAPRGVPHP